ncbi:MAG: Helicase associated domain protein [Magnetococcus sp. MYC-9]
MFPNHSQALSLLQRGLFNGLSRFAQLEARLAELATAEAQFVAFSVFAEAFLAIRSLPQAAEIWPEGTIPLEARRRHALPERMGGADGIFRTLSGEIHPYQLCFRPGRPPLERKEAARFLELAERVPQPLLFTNLTTLPPSLRNQGGFHCVLGHDLDRLTARDFNAMRRWLQGGGLLPERPALIPQQARYVAALQPFLERHDRLLGVVAPGVGVELLALKWAEAAGMGRTVLVVSPSLVHLRETLLLWRRHVVWSDLATLWVGNELASGADAAQVRQADWDLPLVTESEAVRRFLAWRFQGVKLVMTTYGSVRMIARAMVGCAPLDLAIFLDCQESQADPFVLEEGNLPLRRRLFLNATTHHANPASRDADGDPKPLWNLADNPLYGPVVPVAPLPVAVADGLLRPWQLLIALVPCHLSAPATDAEWISVHAYALGLAAACADLHHVQAYHGTVQESRAFAAADLNRLWETLPGLPAPARDPLSGQPAAWLSLHLEGTATAAERQGLLEQFGQATRAILNSARCLSDGISPPVADLLFFSATGKKVKWDLARAMGAVLAKPPPGVHPAGRRDASLALLCTPLLSSRSVGEEDIALLAKRTLAAADSLWLLVQQLRELDQTLETQIAQAGEAYGRNGLWPAPDGGHPLAERFRLLGADGLPADWVELIWHAFLERLTSLWDRRFGQWQRSDGQQEPHLVEWVEQQRRLHRKGGLRHDRLQRLQQAGFVWDPKQAVWDGHYAALQRFLQQHGHGKVPSHWPEDPHLADWVQQQRREALKGRLTADARARLEAVGFVWDPEQSAWDALFEAFQTFHQQHGHGQVPEQWPSHPALAEWAKQQRSALAKGMLPTRRVEALDALGFCWDLEQARWEEQFAAFLQFKQHHAHAAIPEIWPENPALAFWAKEQRRERLRGKLSLERQLLLDEWGFCWDLEAAYWEARFDALLQFQQAQGHCLVPASWPEDPLLADWVGKQRRDWRGNRLSEERKQRLDDLGFVWDPEEKAWQDRWAALLAFHAEHGHCHVPDEQTELADWLRQQRRAGLGRSLSDARRGCLESLGFIWEPQEAEWDAMRWALQRFREEHNHCIVPTQLPENPALARWVGVVRRGYAQGTLPAERIQQLTALGFIWDAKAILWEEMFAALAEFRRQYGNCLVPESYPENNQLAWWVVAQRKAYKSGQLEPERIERLNDLGFFWDPLEVQWYEMFLALVRYREQHGCCVIRRGAGDPRLASWVATQRQARLHGHLSQLRIDRLDELGFLWDQKEVVLEEMLIELQLFKQQHGHCNVPVPWPQHPALGLWVQFQRQEYKKGHLDPRRIERLDALGFVWE